MVVTNFSPPALIRALLALIAALVLTVGLAGPAAAQEPAQPDESSTVADIADTAAGLSQCTSATGVVSSAVAEITDAVGIDSGMTSCLDGVSDVAAAPLEAARNVVEGAWEKAGLSFGEAGAAALKFALGWWISIPGQDEPAYQTVLSNVGAYTYDIQLAFLMVSIILLGGKLALARSGAIRQVSEEGFRQLARATVIAGSIGFFVVVGTRISDGFSAWFIDSTVGDDPAALVEAMVRITTFATPGGIAMLFAIGLIGIIGGLLMVFLLLMRMGMLVVVSAFLPIAAAAGGTRIGASAYERLIAWTLAFLLFKPVGAFVIGISAMLFAQSAPSQDQDGGMMTAVVGALLLACTALVLPSLMKLLMPEAAGGVGGLAAAGAMIGAAVQVGSMVATGGGSAATQSAGAAGGAAAGGGVDGWSPSSSSGPVPSSFGVGPASGGGSDGGGVGSREGGPSSSSMPTGSGGADTGTQAAGRSSDAAAPPAASGGSAPDSFGTGASGPADGPTPGQSPSSNDNNEGFQL
jgi:type IV secretion system protein TrbL